MLQKLLGDLQTPSQRRAMIPVLGAFLLVMAIFAASWADDSKMSSLGWIPEDVAEWADRTPNFRTALPFSLLPFCLCQAMGWLGIRMKHAIVASYSVSGLVLIAAEMGQIFIPSRTADWCDVGWGMAGVTVGTALGLIFFTIIGKIQKKTFVHQKTGEGK